MKAQCMCQDLHVRGERIMWKHWIPYKVSQNFFVWFHVHVVGMTVHDAGGN